MSLLSLIVQSLALLPWRKANTTKFWVLLLCYNFIFFFLLFQSLPEGCTLQFLSGLCAYPLQDFFQLCRQGLGQICFAIDFTAWRKVYVLNTRYTGARLLSGLLIYNVGSHNSHRGTLLHGTKRAMSLATMTMISLHVYHILNRINE